MPQRVDIDNSTGTCPKAGFLTSLSSKCKNGTKRRPRQQKSTMVHVPPEKELSLPLSKGKRGKSSTHTNVFSMNCPPMRNLFQTRSSWRKKHATHHGNDSGDEALWDPLAAIIEEAKNATDIQRVRVIRFDLDRNELIDETTPVPVPLPTINDQRARKISSILHSNKSNIKNLVKSINLNPASSDSENVTSKIVTSIIQKTPSDSNSNPSSSKFDEDTVTTFHIKSILQNGQKYHLKHNYPKAAKLFLDAMSLLNKRSYPTDHALRQEAHNSIHETHHAHKNLEHSANIVKIGLGLEAKGELIKALKMYTVAFRIRKESLGTRHPSLPVLLNLLGAVQVKRGQYDEAMDIFELALYGKSKGSHSPNQNSVKRSVKNRTGGNAGTFAVSMREIGAIHEHFGRLEEAMTMYHESLDCVMKDLREVESSTHSCENTDKKSADFRPPSPCSTVPSEESYDVCVVSASSSTHTDSVEEMEIYLQESSSHDCDGGKSPTNLGFFYDSFFQITEMKSRKMNIHVATTLHSIANIHRKQHEYNLALSSYHASLRGMKLVHGEKHQNVAAVLGNIGNLLKDMKDYDRAFDIYQSVLKIESLRLGYSHHDVMISMLNVAMIEKCRHRHEESIALHKEVIKIQQSRQKDDKKRLNLLAVAHSHLGDVYEKIGEFTNAIDVYKDALVIRTQALEEFHPDLGLLLHKLGCLCSKDKKFRHADAYFTKALRLYMNNCVNDERVVRVQRDKADNQMKLELMPTNGLSSL
jgi:tetratricopeptide (TPR) repeat protein